MSRTLVEDALQMKGRGHDMAAVELFAKASETYQRWGLLRRAAEIFAEASECELAMERLDGLS